jgi:VWFA-related protein
MLFALLALQPQMPVRAQNSSAAALPNSSSTQSTPTQSEKTSTQPESDKAEEITSRDETTTFKVNVNLVQVRVVVRDQRGRTVGNLTKDDFQVFDNRKPQVISHFSAEKVGAQRMRTHVPDAATGTEDTPASGGEEVAEKYVAYLFDDVHLNFGDLAQARRAAEHYLESLPAADRAAIFTTSGQTQLDFTNDHANIHDALIRLQPRPITRTNVSGCFDITYYMADLIVNKRDLEATEVATQDALTCEFNGDKRMLTAAQNLAQSTAQQMLQSGIQESHVALTVVNDVVRRMSVLPGQRNLVLISPGFLTPEMESEYETAIDHALRSQVIISTLDARGLYVVDPNGDIANRAPPSAASLANKQQFPIREASLTADVLLILAEGSGGTFFHNSNDLEQGLRLASETPEYSYVLAFSPQNLKLDGGFHSVKVTLKDRGKYSVQARRGYFAPKHAADPAQEAKQEIEEALFSQDDAHTLPVQLHTQFFKASEANAKLTVLAHIDVRRLALKKVDGRNHDELTVVSALFNGNGNLLQGIQKKVTMRIKDETLEKGLGSGITVRTSFDVKPGSYLVRLVVRDAEAQTVSAESDAVRIP